MGEMIEIEAKRKGNQRWYEIEAGIDYLRCVLPKTGSGRTTYTNVTETLDLFLKGRGEESQPMYRYGFTGYATKHVFWGWRSTDYIIDISGPIADTIYNRYPNLSQYCTRIDPQITVYTEQPPHMWLEDRYIEVLAETTKRVKEQQFHVSFYGEGKEKETIYVGSRNSDQFGRIYDKNKKNPKQWEKGTVRLEVQYENHFARKAAALFESTLQPSALTARAIALEWFRTRGVALPQELVYTSLPLPTYPTRNEDTERTIKWFQEQVKPAVTRLLPLVSRVTLLDALGLLDPDEEAKE